MRKAPFLVLFFAVFALVPVFLAWGQGVPVRSTYQSVILFVSLTAFGILLGEFWLSRLLPNNVVQMKASGIARWHRVIGYVAGAVVLPHPVLIVSRRFWVEESNPVDNLLIILRTPSLRMGIAAWILLVLIIVLCFVRRSFRGRTWRVLHGVLSVGFAGLATCHVVALGRHSDLVMSVFWIVLAGGSIIALLLRYLPKRPQSPSGTEKGATHEATE